MKKYVSFCLFLCAFSWAPLVSLADEAVNEEPPSSEAPVTNQTITLKYLDVDTNEEISPADLLTGTQGESVPLTIKKIDGYELSDVIFTKELTFLNTNYEFPVHYVKLPQDSQTEPSAPIETEVPATSDQSIPSSTSNSLEPEKNTTPPKTSEESIPEQTRSTSTDTSTSSTETSQDKQKVGKNKPAAKVTPSKKKTQTKNNLPAAGEEQTPYLPLIGLTLVGFVFYVKHIKS